MCSFCRIHFRRSLVVQIGHFLFSSPFFSHQASSLNQGTCVAARPRRLRMHVKPIEVPLVPTKPQLHSRRHHDAYNGARHLPKTVWVRSPTLQNVGRGDYTLVYEIILYFGHNRACTIYRSWDDFVTLRRGLTPWKRSAMFCSHHDVRGLDRFLREALAKRARECAMEYFLRRRIDDCGGRC